MPNLKLIEIRERWNAATKAEREASAAHRAERAALEAKHRTIEKRLRQEADLLGDQWRAIYHPLNRLAERLYVDTARPQELEEGPCRVVASWRGDRVHVLGYFEGVETMEWLVHIQPPSALFSTPCYAISFREFGAGDEPTKDFVRQGGSR